MADVTRTAQKFARKLESLYGDGLIAAVLYGSAARGDFRPGISDLNVLVILETLDLAQLRRAAPLVADWAKAGNPPPLMLTDSEWRSSADVFPIEYSDIRDAHLLLAGRDPFGDLHIHHEYLRLQLEHELRSKKIQLREGYLAAGDSPEQLGMLLMTSLPTFLTMFRAIQRLVGAEPIKDPAALSHAVASRVGFDPAPIDELIRRRADGGGLEATMDGQLATGYLAAVERTTRWLDGFKRASPPEAEI